MFLTAPKGGSRAFIWWRTADRQISAIITLRALENAGPASTSSPAKDTRHQPARLTERYRDRGTELKTLPRTQRRAGAAEDSGAGWHRGRLHRIGLPMAGHAG